MPAPASSLVAGMLGDESYTRRCGAVAVYVSRLVYAANGGQIAGDTANPNGADTAARLALAKRCIAGSFNAATVARVVALDSNVLSIITANPSDPNNAVTDSALISATQSAFTMLANSGV